MNEHLEFLCIGDKPYPTEKEANDRLNRAKTDNREIDSPGVTYKVVPYNGGWAVKVTR